MIEAKQEVFIKVSDKRIIKMKFLLKMFDRSHVKRIKQLQIYGQTSKTTLNK